MKFKKLFQNIFLSHIEKILYYHFAMFVGWKVVSFWKVNSGKVNYFSIFDSVMKNKLENIFQYLVIS
jgi:hypothetical protein